MAYFLGAIPPYCCYMSLDSFTTWLEITSRLERSGLPVVILPRVAVTIFGWEFDEKVRPFDHLRHVMATRSVKFYLLVGLGKVELWTADPTAAHDILLRVREFETPEDIRLALGGFPPNVMTTNGDQWARHRRVVSTVIDKRISKNAFEESMRQTNSPLDELFSSPTGGKPDSTDTLQLFDMLKKVTIHGFLGAGFGGSNSAIIVEEAPSRPPYSGPATNGMNGTSTVATDDRRLLTSYMSTLDEYLAEEAPEDNELIKDLSHALGQRRTHHPHRTFAVAASVASLQEKLSTAKLSTKGQIIAFAFTGQSAQYAQMTSGLRRYKVSTTAMEEAETHLQTMRAPWSLTKELAKPAPESRINKADFSQPARTAVQLALLALLRSWGIIPYTVIGHSSGEIAAAFAQG
ncbi:hypothetical protein BDV29DRAFT_157400 [Aspergillus leporis]|uniref:Malonyl-CoA:ACP transacylase (MAT) domain-containing protein n=1 Tax=Aspergillus leporis TaxID=41062 RepID=A0A5N5X0U2_9EURO|nr:hypothetical protein BDV29DRAFT_157400 [Aspergillus leporis]